MIAIKKADASSIPVIKELAHRTWEVTYKDILSAEQMNYMLYLIYDESALQKQMEQGHQFVIVFENKKAAGFASYSPKNDNELFIYKLHKIYIDPNQQGKGIGIFLLD